MSLIPIPKQAESGLPCSCASPSPLPLLGYFLFYSTIKAKVLVNNFSGLLQEALGHEIFGGSVGG